MLFTVITSGEQPPNNHEQAYLVEDRWDDWGKYQTMFDLVVFDEKGTRHDIGSVKIGEHGLQPNGQIEPGKRAPTLDREFDTLTKKHFSLGQGETYYESLNTLSERLRSTILRGLRDCAFDLKIFELAHSEDVMTESLMRSVPYQNVRNRFHRLAHGDAQLTEFRFDYRMAESKDSDSTPPTLSFHVEPMSEPPTNVHVLIGRNGAGKTRCMTHLANAILGVKPPAGEDFGNFEQSGLGWNAWSFAGLVGVSFSVFDSFHLAAAHSQIGATMIGLKKSVPSENGAVKTKSELADDFAASLRLCRTGPRRQRWLDAVMTLGSDPLFQEARVEQLADLREEEWNEASLRLFGRLSSGHAIVLLTVTRLVELVDERTLVLIDEPEVHLHPPLLSAFIRALSDLLIKRNGVAIVATHSPVVLQEVPMSCVWMLYRSNEKSVAKRPSRETFGENVGVLTREIFGLEVEKAGFYRLIQAVAEKDTNEYETVLEHFHQQLGTEARALARALLPPPPAGGSH